MPTSSDLVFRVPTSWHSLSNRQLSYLCSLLAAGFEEQEVRLRMLLHCGSLTPATPPRHALPTDHYFYHYSQRKPLRITAAEFERHLAAFDFIASPPTAPLLPPIDNRRPTDPFLTDLPFGHYLVVQNYYLRHTLSRQPELLTQIARILWDFDDNDPDPSPDTQLIYHTALHLFFIGLSAWLARQFPYLYGDSNDDCQGAPPDIEAQRAQTDAMIRALTGGDVTKEDQVQNVPTIRALTELNEKAREARELKQMNK